MRDTNPWFSSMHTCTPSTCTKWTSWDFLEEMEDKLGDTIMICGDFNTSSSLWDRHGTIQQECVLEEVPSNALFTPVSSATPTHLCAWQGDTDSTINQVLVYKRQASWTCAGTLTSQGVDHLPVVFNLQKPGNEPRWKPNICSSMASHTQVCC